jgi:uncharacterized membrane protein YhaH (DUF805 family)
MSRVSDNHRPDSGWVPQPYPTSENGQPAPDYGSPYPDSDQGQYPWGYGQAYPESGQGQYAPGYGQSYPEGDRGQYIGGYGQPPAGPGAGYPAGYPQQHSPYPPPTPLRASTRTLDQPHYGIGPVEAVKRGFVKYARFDGRASRGEFWWFALGIYLGLLVLVLLGGIAAATLGETTTSGLSSAGPLAGTLFSLAGVCYLGTIVPYLAVLVRRLHDGGYSGLLALLLLVPYLGGFVLLILCALPTAPAGARFDRAPGVW